MAAVAPALATNINIIVGDASAQALPDHTRDWILFGLLAVTALGVGVFYVRRGGDTSSQLQPDDFAIIEEKIDEDGSRKS